MGYVESNLLPGEKVIYKATPHWILFVVPVLSIGLGILFMLATLVGWGNFGAILGLFCVFTGLLLALGSAVTFFTIEFGLTNKRIIAKEGFIRRRSIELLLTQVESIGVNQHILGRILNYGTIIVVGTGGTRESFRAIVDPMELRKRVHTQLPNSNQTQ